jgi:RLL motif-containing protein 1
LSFFLFQAKIASSAAEAADIDGAFPLGFELDDQSLARPAALLRARHVAHLRALQSRVDAALVAAQECTADPRTDARLGRVGR